MHYTHVAYTGELITTLLQGTSHPRMFILAGLNQKLNRPPSLPVSRLLSHCSPLLKPT